MRNSQGRAKCSIERRREHNSTGKDGLFLWTEGGYTRYIGAPELGKRILCFSPADARAYPIKTATELLQTLTVNYETVDLRKVKTARGNATHTNESILLEHATMAIVMLTLLAIEHNKNNRVDTLN